MEKKSKKQVIIAVTVLLLVTLTLLGITYAYYRTRIIGNKNDKSISVTSKVLEVTYSDDNAVIAASNISPGDKLTKTFTVENTGNDTATYAVIFDNVENNFIRTNDWTFTLKKGTDVVKSGIIPRTTSYVLTNISIAADVTDTYTLDITYVNSSEDQSIDMGASLSLRVNIADSISTTFDTATSETLLAAIGNDNLISETLTVPGQELSLVTEAILSTTEDDYGTSYYYRGNVENNFVNFSGMCWRVVRVQGDGTIKITLADRDHECNSTDYSIDNQTSAFIIDEVNLDEETSFAYKYDVTNTPADVDYASSDMPSLLSAWLNGEELTYANAFDGNKLTTTFDTKIDTTKLASTNWCSDVSQTSKTFYDSSENIITDEGLAEWIDLNYGAYDRLTNVTAATPTLKCNSIGIDGSTAVKFESKIGLLTADEVAFAGSIYSSSGTSIHSKYKIYLTDNAVGNYAGGYWTMSPYTFAGIYGDNIVWMYIIYGKGYMDWGAIDWMEVGVRPVIVLNKEVVITEGNGTLENPYIVN